jgi:hypothetical protein
MKPNIRHIFREDRRHCVASWTNWIHFAYSQTFYVNVWGA